MSENSTSYESINLMYSNLAKQNFNKIFKENDITNDRKMGGVIKVNTMFLLVVPLDFRDILGRYLASTIKSNLGLPKDPVGPQQPSFYLHILPVAWPSGHVILYSPTPATAAVPGSVEKTHICGVLTLSSIVTESQNLCIPFTKF